MAKARRPAVIATAAKFGAFMIAKTRDS